MENGREAVHILLLGGGGGEEKKKKEKGREGRGIAEREQGDGEREGRRGSSRRR